MSLPSAAVARTLNFNPIVCVLHGVVREDIGWDQIWMPVVVMVFFRPGQWRGMLELMSSLTSVLKLAGIIMLSSRSMPFRYSSLFIKPKKLADPLMASRMCSTGRP